MAMAMVVRLASSIDVAVAWAGEEVHTCLRFSQVSGEGVEEVQATKSLSEIHSDAMWL